MSLFSLDVFGAGYSFRESLLALLIHLVPVYLVVIALLIAWRWEWLGAALFAALGVVYLLWGWGELHWSAYLLVSGPLLLVAVLFLLNWSLRTQLRAYSSDPASN